MQIYLISLFSLPRYVMKHRYIGYSGSSFIITIRSPSRSSKDSRSGTSFSGAALVHRESR
ncbi:hypothetical protein Bca52824_051104 [Brassica carinata]|uniref:Uncharacterized protein n=1 Tax=Brassica carinata TaxID=52824 RepID=A0A8X7UIL6_BRACI|nr:hypothetical protein Bca52824_051104 [Brassica carinata]